MKLKKTATEKQIYKTYLDLANYKEIVCIQMKAIDDECVAFKKPRMLPPSFWKKKKEEEKKKKAFSCPVDLPTEESDDAKVQGPYFDKLHEAIVDGNGYLQGCLDNS